MRRSSHGTIAFIVALIALAIAMLGFFATEIWYAHYTTTQLRNVCDSAGMASAGSLVSSETANGRQSRSRAEVAAKALLMKSSFMGKALDGWAKEAQDASIVTPARGEMLYSVQFVDDTEREAVKGKHIRIDAAVSIAPFSGKLLGLDPYVIRAEGRTAAAKLDLAFCLDDSLSMATDTPISFVCRELGPDGKVTDRVVASDIAKKLKTIGVPEPMYLGSTRGEATTFDPTLRGQNDCGTKPTGTGGATAFTERIINLDGNPQFGGYSEGGFNFPTVAVLVEASRGNLESEAVFESSGAKEMFEGDSGITWKAGYKKKYEQIALRRVEPFNKAKVEIRKFFDNMEANTDSHFALIPFSQRAAQSPTDELEAFPVSALYRQRPREKFQFPKVEFKRNNSQYRTVQDNMDGFKLHGGTDIPGAIKEAVESLNDDSNSRPEARKAVLIFTDGEPTGSAGEDAVQKSIDEAVKAKEHGITIFAIGFLHGGGSERANRCLNGIAQETGGKAFIVQDIDTLHEVFRVISRQLVTLE